jgi:hypothetical protein
MAVLAVRLAQAQLLRIGLKDLQVGHRFGGME